MIRLDFVNCKENVDAIIAGEYSSLRGAQPFLSLLSIHGWHYMRLSPPAPPLSFSSTDHLGEVLRYGAEKNITQRHNIISSFLGFVDELIEIHRDQFSLSSLKKNALGLFTCRVAAHLLFNGFGGSNPTQKLPPADDDQKLKHIASLINDYTFEENGGLIIKMNAGSEILPLLSSDIEAKKVGLTSALVNWFNSEKIKIYEWLPLKDGDKEVAEWCWGRIKALQEKEDIALACPPLATAANSYRGPYASPSTNTFANSLSIVSELESACGGQYQLAVYAYFCFVGDPFTRKMLRNKVADLYRAQKFKANNKGRIINVIVSEKCKSGLDRLTKHHNKKQADILSELIEKACESLPGQGRP